MYDVNSYQGFKNNSNPATTKNHNNYNSVMNSTSYQEYKDSNARAMPTIISPGSKLVSPRKFPKINSSIKANNLLVEMEDTTNLLSPSKLGSNSPNTKQLVGGRSHPSTQASFYQYI